MFSLDVLADTIREMYMQGVDAADYTVEAVESMLERLDFSALYSAIRCRQCHTHAFTTQGRAPKSFNYRGRDLFQQSAAMLFEDMDMTRGNKVLSYRSYELWLLEDMTFVAVACVTIVYPDAEYVCVYREISGDPWNSGMCMDLEGLTCELEKMCSAYYKGETPVYEF